MLCALPALWVGLIYEPQAQAQALALVSDWTAEEREYLRVEVRGLGEDGEEINCACTVYLPELRLSVRTYHLRASFNYFAVDRTLTVVPPL